MYTDRDSKFGISIVTVFCILFCTVVDAQEVDVEPAAEQADQSSYLTPRYSLGDQVLSESLKDIPEVIGYTYKKKDGLIQVDLLEGLRKKLYPIYLFYHEKMNLNLALAYTTLYQKASAGPSYTEAAGDDFDFYGVWTIADDKQCHPTSISFECESRAKWTTIPPQDLGESIGSLWKTVNAFSRYAFTLTQVWWEYQIIRKKFGFRVGKIDLSDYFNLYSFTSTNYNFLNQGLVDDVTIPYPQNGLGGVIGYKPTKESYIIFGIGDMNGQKTSLCFNTFFSRGEYFKGFEVGYKPKIPCRGEGNYNITIWHTDPIKRESQRSSKGVAISLEQEFRMGIVPFLRLGFSDGNASDITRSLSGGFGILRPFCREDDQFAIGGTWGKPKDNQLSGQFMLETYYRLQLSQNVQITPDIEMIVNPTYNSQNNVIGVFSLRMRMSL